MTERIVELIRRIAALSMLPRPMGRARIPLNCYCKHYRAVIRSFANRNTQKLFNGEAVPRLPPEIREWARLRLAQLNAASTLEFMMIPPSNRLEALKGDRKGQHSVRINQQWRICFRWSDGNAFDVEITDYH